jgi:Mg2+/citrate symporter
MSVDFWVTVGVLAAALVLGVAWIVGVREGDRRRAAEIAASRRDDHAVDHEIEKQERRQRLHRRRVRQAVTIDRVLHS